MPLLSLKNAPPERYSKYSKNHHLSMTQGSGSTPWGALDLSGALVLSEQV